MKKVLLLILFIIPIFTSVCVAQKNIKIETDQVDKFSGKRLIETSWVRIYRSTKAPSNVYVRIIHYGSTTAMAVKIMTGNVDAIKKDDELLLKVADGQVYTLNASSYTIAKRGDGAIGLNGSNALGLNVTYKGDLSFLDNNLITDIRIQTSDSKYDLEISEKDQESFPALYKAIKDVLNK